MLLRCRGTDDVLPEGLERTIILLRSRRRLLDLMTIVHDEAGPRWNLHFVALASTTLSLALGDLRLTLVNRRSLVDCVRPFQVLRRRVEDGSGPLHARKQSWSVCVDGVARVDTSCHAVKSFNRIVQAAHARHHPHTLSILILVLTLMRKRVILVILIRERPSTGRPRRLDGHIRLLLLIEAHARSRRIPARIPKLRLLIHVRSPMQPFESLAKDLTVPDFLLPLLILLHEELLPLFQVLFFHLELLFVL